MKNIFILLFLISTMAYAIDPVTQNTPIEASKINELVSKHDIDYINNNERLADYKINGEQVYVTYVEGSAPHNTKILSLQEGSKVISIKGMYKANYQDTIGNGLWSIIGQEFISANESGLILFQDDRNSAGAGVWTQSSNTTKNYEYRVFIYYTKPPQP